MPLKKLPKEMSYAAIRHKHPPTPNHTSEPALVEDTKADKPTEPSHPPQEERKIAAVDDASPVVEAPAKPKQDRAPVDHSQQDPKIASRPAADKTKAKGKGVRVRGYVHIPAIGEYRDFDELRDIYGEKEALALALSRGMASYEAALREANSLESIPRQNRRSSRVEASRTMPNDLYLKAVEHLDPKGMLGRSQIGSRILDVAVAHYLGER